MMKAESFANLARLIGQGWTRSRWGRGNLEIELVAPRLIYRNPYVQVFDDEVRFPGSKATGRFLRITYGQGVSDGAVVMAVTPDDDVLLVRQFRHAVRLWMTELPRGFAQPGEQNRMTSVRELPEETGYHIDFGSMIHLGRLVTDSGKLHDAPHLVLCRARPREWRRPDPTESIASVVKVKFSELRELCERGELLDVFTLAAVVRAQPHFEGNVFRPDLALLTESPLLGEAMVDLRYDDGAFEPSDVPAR